MALPTCEDSLARLRDTTNYAELITVYKDDFNVRVTFQFACGEKSKQKGL